LNNDFNTPILFLVFNRLDTTKQVFETIRKVAPLKLYVASDGPRDTREGEDEKVKTIRDYVLKSIDWKCEVKTLFREKNLGCGKAVSQAITWFFENEEMGIILEDDCLPHIDFFEYCRILLELYKNDSRIFLISGFNKQGLWNPDLYDYFFSNLGGIWGWASWARAWKYFDLEMPDLDDFMKNNNFVNSLAQEIGIPRQDIIYKEMVINKTDTWDYSWGYARHKNNALSCVPSKNLIINIGFGENATHTNDNILQPDYYSLNFPLKINNFIVPDREYDKKFIGYQKANPNIILKYFKKIYKYFKKLFNY